MENQEVNRLIWQAEYYYKKNWIYAVELFEKAISKDPIYTVPYIKLSFLYIGKRLYQKAEHVLRRGLSYAAENPELLFQMGNTLLSQKRREKEALYFYSKIKHQTLDVKYNMALAFSRLGDYQNAIHYLTEVIKNNPKIVNPYYILAEEYISIKDYDNAIRTLKIAEERFPLKGMTYYLKGLARYSKSEYLKAYLDFRRADKLGCVDPNLYRLYGLCFERVGNTKSAVQYLKKSIKIDPMFVNSYIDLSNIYLKYEQFAMATKYLRLARKIEPFNPYLSIIAEKINRMLQAKYKK